MATEFVWLIERNSAGCSPLWWDGRYMADDPNKAIRFSRREDAERVIEAQGLQLVHASENGWVDPGGSCDHSESGLCVACKNERAAFLDEKKANEQ